MKWASLAYLLVLSAVQTALNSQELIPEADEESKFQSVFFDALQQKAMGNTDRAAMLLLEAKSLKPESSVVHHELARAYRLEGKLEAARDHALKALHGDDLEYWFLSTLMEILEESNLTLSDLEENFPSNADSLRVNVARWYIAHNQPEAALNQLELIRNSDEQNKLRLLAQAGIREIADEKRSDTTQAETKDEVQLTKSALLALVEKREWDNAYSKAMEAIEVFPLQPFFYFIAAKAKSTLGFNQDALELLESGAFYLLDGDSLRQEYYQMFAQIHLEAGNEAEYNIYLNKID